MVIRVIPKKSIHFRDTSLKPYLGTTNFSEISAVSPQKFMENLGHVHSIQRTEEYYVDSRNSHENLAISRNSMSILKNNHEHLDISRHLKMTFYNLLHFHDILDIF